MRRFVLGSGLLLSLTGSAQAQVLGQPFPSGGGGYGPYQQQGYGPYQQQGFGSYQQFGAGGSQNFMPNIYNPATQPLSPYLNLLRGGNAGVNYYYGVRPGTLGGAGRFGGAPFFSMGGTRPVFFPQLAMAPDPLESATTGPANILPPAGHPVVFGNTMGFFPAGGVQAGGSRAGLGGIGGGRPAQRR